MRETERQRAELEERLRQAHKMEALGTLAGGIAHDFNNILSAITGYSELALDNAAEGAPVADELGQIISAADRAKELVRQILAFSRKGAFEPRPLNLSKVASQAVSHPGAHPAQDDLHRTQPGPGPSPGERRPCPPGTGAAEPGRQRQGRHARRRPGCSSPPGWSAWTGSSSRNTREAGPGNM